jgi:integrase
VYKRGKAWAVLVERGSAADGTRRRLYKGGYRTKSEAKQAEVAFKSQLMAGTYVDRSSIKVSDYFDSWLLQQHGLKPTTLAGYRSHVVNHVVPRLGEVRLQELSPAMLNAFYSDLISNGRVKRGGEGTPLSRTTVRLIHAVLRRALQDAVRSGLLVRNPADAATKPKRDASSSGSMRTWTASQVSTFLALSKDDRLHAVWVVFATTGARRGEVLGLHWDDVDLDRGVASIRRTLVVVDRRAIEGTPKTGHGRLISLAGPTVDALRRWRVRQLAERLQWGETWQDLGLVFTREDGTSLHPDSITDDFKKLCARSELPRVRLHDLRHSWATLALEAGVPLKVVSENLGHSSIRITSDVYSHVNPGMAADAVAKVASSIFDQ